MIMLFNPKPHFYSSKDRPLTEKHENATIKKNNIGNRVYLIMKIFSSMGQKYLLP